ncbi:IS1595 family transposase [Taibaiella lutea]|nr:IS1595 family transposase [Taibaiella lutea]
MSYQEFCKQYPNEDACLDKIFKMRYGGMKECPRCGHRKPFTRIKGRRAFQCRNRKACGYQLYPLADSPLKCSKLPISKWVYCIHMFACNKTGLTARFLSKVLTVSPKTALRMLKIAREFLIENDRSPLKGSVQTDESFFYGSIPLMNKKRREKVYKEFNIDKKKQPRGRALLNKSLVLGLVEKDGRAITEIIPNAELETLRPLIYQFVERGSDLLTDELPVYRFFSKHYIHKTCNHQKKVYQSENGGTTNAVESLWSLYKRIFRAHVSVSKKYFPLYIKQCTYIFNNRKNTLEKMFSDLFVKMVHPILSP